MIWIFIAKIFLFLLESVLHVCLRYNYRLQLEYIWSCQPAQCKPVVFHTTVVLASCRLAYFTFTWLLAYLPGVPKAVQFEGGIYRVWCPVSWPRKEFLFGSEGLRSGIYILGFLVQLSVCHHHSGITYISQFVICSLLQFCHQLPILTQSPIF